MYKLYVATVLEGSDLRDVKILGEDFAVLNEFESLCPHKL